MGGSAGVDGSEDGRTDSTMTSPALEPSRAFSVGGAEERSSSGWDGGSGIRILRRFLAFDVFHATLCRRSRSIWDAREAGRRSEHRK